MTLTQLQYFYAVCRCGSVTRAAVELHISQPSLSHAMHSLEREFGVSLFRRQSRGLALTAEGEALLEETEALLARVRQLTDRMNQLAQKQTVRLGVSPMLATLILPALLKAFHDACPEATLKTVENGTLAVRDLVLDGTLDGAVICNDGELPAAFARCDLLQLNICLYAPADKAPTGNTFSELVRSCPVPLVCRTEDSFLTEFMVREFKRRDLSPEVLLYTHQVSTIHRIISDGMAAAFLYDGVLESEPAIVKIPCPELPRLWASLVWDAARPPSGPFHQLVRLARGLKFL